MSLSESECMCNNPTLASIISRGWYVKFMHTKGFVNREVGFEVQVLGLMCDSIPSISYVNMTIISQVQAEFSFH